MSGNTPSYEVRKFDESLWTQTCSDGENIYSIGMMFMYLEKFPKTSKKIALSDLFHVLEYKCWGDVEGDRVSPLEVIKNQKRFPKEAGVIQNSDLEFPIIISEEDQYVFDGRHRLAKASMMGLVEIDTYFLCKDISDKCILGKCCREGRAFSNAQTYKSIEDLFAKRFPQ
jgi:hypothetical protein